VALVLASLATGSRADELTPIAATRSVSTDGYNQMLWFDPTFPGWQQLFRPDLSDPTPSAGQSSADLTDFDASVAIGYEINTSVAAQSEIGAEGIHASGSASCMPASTRIAPWADAWVITGCRLSDLLEVEFSVADDTPFSLGASLTRVGYLEVLANSEANHGPKSCGGRTHDCGRGTIVELLTLEGTPIETLELPMADTAPECSSTPLYPHIPLGPQLLDCSADLGGTGVLAPGSYRLRISSDSELWGLELGDARNEYGELDPTYETPSWADERMSWSYDVTLGVGSEPVVPGAGSAALFALACSLGATGLKVASRSGRRSAGRR